MKIIEKGFIIIAVILGFILNGSVASAAEKVRYVDDITNNYKITEDITFSEVKNYKGALQTLQLDVYEPAEDTAVYRPVVVWVHGGNLQIGVKEDNASLAIKLAKKGFVVVSLNYRLNPNPYVSADTFNNTMRDALTDVESAVKWVRENTEQYGMDSNNIILGGYSSGAEIIDNLYYNDFYVPNFDRTGIIACISQSGDRLFYPAPEDKVSTVGNPNTKCLVIHGTKDTTNPVRDINIFATQLGGRGVIKLMDGYTHYWQGDKAEKLIIKTITDFLSENITFTESAQTVTQDGSLFNQIKVSPIEDTLYVGGTKVKSIPIKISLPENLVLAGKVNDTKASDSVGEVTVTYNSNNNSIAKVNRNGVITAKGIGTAVISTKVTLADGKSKFFSTRITVKKPYIEITKRTLSIKKGKTFTFEAKANGLDDKNTVWSSSKKSILVIDKKTGKATAKAKGSAYVTAKNGAYVIVIRVVVQ